MRYRFGPSASRTVSPALASLLAIGLVGIDAVDGVEQVKVSVPAAPPPPVVRPTRIFAVYSPAPRPTARPPSSTCRDPTGSSPASRSPPTRRPTPCS